MGDAGDGCRLGPSLGDLIVNGDRFGRLAVVVSSLQGTCIGLRYLRLLRAKLFLEIVEGFIGCVVSQEDGIGGEICEGRTAEIRRPVIPIFGRPQKIRDWLTTW